MKTHVSLIQFCSIYLGGFIIRFTEFRCEKGVQLKQNSINFLYRIGWLSVIWVLSISKYSRPMNKYISICVNEPTNISSTQMNGHTKYNLPKAIPTRSADFLLLD